MTRHISIALAWMVALGCPALWACSLCTAGSSNVSSWREVVRSLRNGDVELGIGFTDDLDSRHLYVPVADQPQQIYCGPEHRFFGKPAVAPALLESEPFVVTQDEPIPYIRYRDRYGLGRQIGLEKRPHPLRVQRRTGTGTCVVQCAASAGEVASSQQPPRQVTKRPGAVRWAAGSDRCRYPSAGNMAKPGWKIGLPPSWAYLSSVLLKFGKVSARGMA